jgi:flavin reductase (DIM6/NTAB) family NADH-FMN oxidoreductase RutF
MTAPWKENCDMAKKKEFPLAQVYGLLEPGPVVLVTTARAGRANIMPMSWHTMMEFVPPLSWTPCSPPSSTAPSSAFN